jgi:predicted adenylyl cyclase CyaB
MIHDIYYDTPDGQLETDKKRVRIRKQWTSTLITMKTRIKSKSLRKNEEDEIAVPTLEAWDALLRSYGRQPTREKKKMRIAYSFHNVHFDIDIYDWIPPILEIEAENKETIFAWIKKLWLEKKTTATYGSRGLFKAYNQTYMTITD